jgi:erythromycin esterase
MFSTKLTSLRPSLLPIVLIVFIAAEISTAQQPTTVPAVEAQALLVNQPIERELKAGETHAYAVELAAGQFLRAAVDQRGIDVVVRVFAPDHSGVLEIDSPNGDRGPEPVEFETKLAGAYRIEVAPADPASPAGKYEIKIIELLSVEANAARLAAVHQKQAAVVAELKRNAIPIKTVEAGNGFTDLQPLKRILKDVRYVGLGEQTHGTREFFQFKHRMVEFLVREMGFRVFAIEASYAGCRNINDYIQGRTSDGAKALDSQGFWTWNTEEVRAMLEWMRTYNASAAPDQKLKFVGFDIQTNREARDSVLAYLQKVAPERAAAYAALPLPGSAGAPPDTTGATLESLVAASLAPSPKKNDAEKKVAEIRAQYNEMLGFLTLNETKFIVQTSPAEYADALHSARVIAQYMDAFLQPPGGATSVDQRDLFMAENFAGLAAAEPPATRFIIWAHNYHIASPSNSRFRFGSRLRAMYGAQYYNIGFSFDHGGFQAREGAPKDPAHRMLTGFTFGPAPDVAIDLRGANAAPTLAEWLTTPRPMRAVGAIFAPGNESAYYSPETLQGTYDGIFFIDATTRARPNPSVRDVAPVSK